MPDAIFEMMELRELVIDNNALNSIPEAIGKLRKLKKYPPLLSNVHNPLGYR